MTKSLVKLSLMFTFLTSHILCALTVNDFTYVNGAATENYSLDGKPDNMTNINDTLPTDVLNNIYSRSLCPGNRPPDSEPCRLSWAYRE